MGKNRNIEKLNQVGQSIWYDNLSKEVLDNGELKRLVEAGVSGLTSNPTIFKKAIADTTFYDDEIKTHARAKLEVEDICEQLFISDVGRAADLLRPVYDSTNGADGYASVEVSPFLAGDTSLTVVAGKRLWKSLNRPNIMIKVPATNAGLPAIEELLAAGINVNVTLIFSGEVYRSVAERYITALEKRVVRGEPIDKIASVASFFVSRVDSKVEGWLKSSQGSERANQDKFFGKVGIANSRAAYAMFEEIFSSSRFKALVDKKVKVQRPLWASTGTKNPAFSPLLYIEQLAAPETVNTVPPQTLSAILEGISNIAWPWQQSGEASQLLIELQKSGAPWSLMLEELQSEGVKLFADSYQELLDAIRTRVSSITNE